MENYIGIDVAKHTFELCRLNQKEIQQFENNKEGIRQAAKMLGSLKPKLVVMEATGGYEAMLAAGLYLAGLPVAVVNPMRIRNFARANGQLAKTDKLDAQAANRRPASPVPWSYGFPHARYLSYLPRGATVRAIARPDGYVNWATGKTPGIDLPGNKGLRSPVLGDMGVFGGKTGILLDGLRGCSYNEEQNGCARDLVYVQSLDFIGVRAFIELSGRWRYLKKQSQFAGAAIWP